MPTGYTAKLMEEGQTFPQFAMTCARAFGALIEMRDEDLDKPIPENLTGFDNGYHSKAIAEAQQELKRLEGMSKEDAHKFGLNLKRETLDAAIEGDRKDRLEQQRLRDMKASVLKWEPPTKDHEGMKKFMLEQIEVCESTDSYYETRIKEIQLKTPLQFYEEGLASARRDVEYHTKEQANEQERNKGRNEWLEQLRASLTPAPLA